MDFMTNSGNRTSVLVTDASYKHAVGIARVLGLSGYQVGVTSHRAFAAGFYSRYTGRHARTADPRMEGAAFIDDLLQCGREWKTEVLLPVGFASCAAVAEHRARLTAAGMASVGPSLENFRRCADKWQITQIAREAGLKTPETQAVGGPDQLGAFVRAQGPAVLKHRFESAGGGAAYVDERTDPDVLWNSRAPASAQTGGSDLIIQERVRGAGGGYIALAHHGRIVREFAHRRLREFPASGGPATAAISIHDDALMAAGRRLIEAVAWHGVAMVEFKSNAAGHFVIEFNPKFWGSMELALASGADFAGDYCRMAGGEDLRNRPLPAYRVGVRFWWPWRGDLRRLLQKPADAWEVLKDLASPRAQSNVWWRDPLPNCVEMLGEFTYPFRQHGA
jgi:predicted ATP-grasp superfamily ATP-dependent carboligase